MKSRRPTKWDPTKGVRMARSASRVARGAMSGRFSSIFTPFILIGVALMTVPVAGEPASPKNAAARPSTPPPLNVRIADDTALFALLRADRPELEPIRRAAAAENLDEARRLFCLHLANRKSPTYFFTRDDGPALLKTFETISPGYSKSQIAAAHKMIARDIAIEGDRRQLARKIEWLQGPLEWTNVLSRFMYWESELVAWWKTGDAKYAEDFVDVMRQWVDANPAPDRIDNTFSKNGNVWRTLEMGIRGDNWMRAFTGFFNAPCFTDADKVKMTRSLVEHARLLHAFNKDRGYAAGNWQVVEVTGLLSIALSFPEFEESDAWRDTALRTLESHLEKGVYADGAFMECTPGYHNWVAERLMTAARLCEINGVSTPLLEGKYRRMYEFLLAIATPDRAMPMVGDCGRSPRNVCGPLANAALLFQDSQFRFFASDDVSIDAVWIFGPDAAARYRAIAPKRPAFTSTRLPDSGFITMRSGWQNDARYLFFNAVRYGGGHSHPDSLSVDIFADRLLVTDSGRENYNHPLHRQYYRKTRAHNVVVIGGREQPLKLDPVVEAWETNETYDFARASIAYDGFTHRRSVVFIKPDYWVIRDEIEGSGETEEDLEQIWNFPPSTVKVDGTSSIRTDDNGKTNLHIIQAQTDGLSASVEEGWYGPNAGASVHSPTGVFRKRAALPAMFVTVLYPVRAGNAPVVELESDRTGSAGKGAKSTVDETVVRIGKEDRVVIRSGVAESGGATSSTREPLVEVTRKPESNPR